MLSNKVVLLFLCFLATCLTHSSFSKSQNEYTYSNAATGGTDIRKLRYLNEAVNPYSQEFIKKYIKKGDRVLDLGCGSGIMSQQIAKAVGQTGYVLGVDISTEQVQIAKNLAQDSKIKNLDFKQCSAYELAKINDKFDVVYMRFMLVNLDKPYDIAEQVKLVLKKGGYLIIEEMLGNDISSRPYDYRLELVRKVNRMANEVKAVDFKVPKYYGKFLRKNGYKVVANKVAKPKLDTLTKRRNLSLSMRLLENMLVENKKINKSKLYSMIKHVEKVEENKKIEIHFYRIGQIAAILT
jgi:ubiquinone/menaquinone biosynthesis C-methylase UbiE